MFAILGATQYPTHPTPAPLLPQKSEPNDKARSDQKQKLPSRFTFSFSPVIHHPTPLASASCEDVFRPLDLCMSQHW
jgi:hypothetical protein